MLSLAIKYLPYSSTVRINELTTLACQTVFGVNNDKSWAFDVEPFKNIHFFNLKAKEASKGYVYDESRAFSEESRKSSKIDKL